MGIGGLSAELPTMCTRGISFESSGLEKKAIVGSAHRCVRNFRGTSPSETPTMCEKSMYGGRALWSTRRSLSQPLLLL